MTDPATTPAAVPDVRERFVRWVIRRCEEQREVFTDAAFTALAQHAGMRVGTAPLPPEASRALHAAHAYPDLDIPHHPRQAVLDAVREVGAACPEVLRRTGDPLALRVAVVAYRQVMRWAQTEPHRARLLSETGDILFAEYQREPRPALLSEACALARDAAVHAPRGDRLRPRIMAFLGAVRCLEYDRDGDTEALAESITAHREAVELTAIPSPGDWRMPKEEIEPLRKLGAERLAALGRVLLHRHELTAAAADVDEAVQVYGRAAAIDPAAHLHAYAHALLHRFRRTPGPENLTDALDSASRAAHTSAAGRTVLGRALRARFDHLGDAEDLRRAAALLDGDPSEKGAVLLALYEHTGDSAALDDAVAALRRAADSGSGDPAARTLRQLGQALLLKADRLDEPQPLEEAVAALRTASRAPLRPRERSRVLSLLARAQHRRSLARGGRPHHAEEARMLAQQVLAEHPDGDAQRTALLLELQDVLPPRAGAAPADGPGTAPPSAAGTAVAKPARLAPRPANRPSSASTPVHPPPLPHTETSRPDPGTPLTPRDAKAAADQGLALAADFERMGDPEARRQALVQLAAAARTPSGAAHVRAQAGRAWAGLAAGAGEWAAAAEAFGIVVDLLPRLADAALRRDDQEHRLVPYTGLASDAAACALRAGATARAALDVLERGRGVLLAHASATRSPSAGAATETEAEGPVVAVNVSRYGCHALVTEAGRVSAIPLPDLSAQDVDERAEAFALAVDVAGESRCELDLRWAAGRYVERTLGWLWDAVARPVLTELYGPPSTPPPGRPPRLWWLPTGLLGFLPLHAAGHHDRPGGQTVLDRVVSSYTPTLRALRAAPSPASVPQPLVVAMPRTDGHPDLPGASEESVAIRRWFPQARPVSGPYANRANVLAQLERWGSVHFACHARSRVDAPSAGALLLDDGELTVADISRLRVRGAYLAFLSACATARGGVRLADEAIHISSAFQLAGFPHVIATLWPIVDDVATEIAGLVYRRLAPPARPDPARAVHAAVLHVRESTGGRSPLLWASHIHIGV